jgi:hypothetical protein
VINSHRPLRRRRRIDQGCGGDDVYVVTTRQCGPCSVPGGTNSSVPSFAPPGRLPLRRPGAAPRTFPSGSATFSGRFRGAVVLGTQASFDVADPSASRAPTCWWRTAAAIGRRWSIRVQGIGSWPPLFCTARLVMLGRAPHLAPPPARTHTRARTRTTLSTTHSSRFSLSLPLLALASCSLSLSSTCAPARECFAAPLHSATGAHDRVCGLRCQLRARTRLYCVRAPPPLTATTQEGHFLTSPPPPPSSSSSSSFSGLLLFISRPLHPRFRPPPLSTTSLTHLPPPPFSLCPQKLVLLCLDAGLGVGPGGEPPRRQPRGGQPHCGRAAGELLLAVADCIRWGPGPGRRVTGNYIAEGPPARGPADWQRHLPPTMAQGASRTLGTPPPCPTPRPGLQGTPVPPNPSSQPHSQCDLDRTLESVLFQGGMGAQRTPPPHTHTHTHTHKPPSGSPHAQTPSLGTRT